MNSMVFVAMLGVSALLWGGAQGQEYNLRTVPSTPQAGAPFVVAFESTDCEAWVLLPLGEAPTVMVQGQTLRLEVDRITIANCSYPVETNAVSVPALAAGNYQLELIARAYQSPGNNIFAQAINFQVGQAISLAPIAIPAMDRWALAWLAAVVAAGTSWGLARHSR